MDDPTAGTKNADMRARILRRLAEEKGRAEKAKLRCYVELIDVLAENRQGHDQTMRTIAVGSFADLAHPDLCGELRREIERVRTMEAELLKLIAEDRFGDPRWDEALDEVVEAVRRQGELMQRIAETRDEGVDPEAPPRVLH